METTNVTVYTCHGLHFASCRTHVVAQYGDECPKCAAYRRRMNVLSQICERTGETLMAAIERAKSLAATNSLSLDEQLSAMGRVL